MGFHKFFISFSLSLIIFSVDVSSKDGKDEGTLPKTSAPALSLPLAQKCLRLGVEAHNQNKFPMAETYFRRIADDYPEARNYLGIALEAQGKREEAASYYRQVINEAGNNRLMAVQTMARLGTLLAQTQNYDEAEWWFNQSIQEGSLLGNPEFDLGDAAFKFGALKELKGDQGGAITQYRQAIQNGCAQAISKLAILLSKSDNQADRDEAVKLLREAIRNNDFSQWSNLGRVLLAQGNLNEAKEACLKGIQQGNDRAHCMLGNVLKQIGDSEGAIIHYRTAIENDHSGDAMFALADLLIHRNKGNDLQEAEVLLRRASEGNHTNATIRLGQLLEREKN